MMLQVDPKKRPRVGDLETLAALQVGDSRQFSCPLIEVEVAYVVCDICVGDRMANSPFCVELFQQCQYCCVLIVLSLC